jgi:ribosomal protein S27AE
MSKIDEITRLHILMSDGAITKEEIEMLKKNILSDSKTKTSVRSKVNKEIKEEEPKIKIEQKKVVLKKITCSNCGAELLFDPDTQLTSCNFCGSHFEIKNAVDEEVIVPEGIVPFTVSKKNYQAGTLAWLSDGAYTPVDILESSIFSSANGIYIPVWFFHGKYRGNWSASSGYDYEAQFNENIGGKWEVVTRVVTDWRPSSGNCDGELNSLGYASDDAKIELIVYTTRTFIKKHNIKPFDSRYTLGFNLMKFNKENEEETWEQYGKISADSYVESQVLGRIPGDHYKDFYVEADFTKENPKRIYVPVWITYYTYKGQQYYVWMDGQDQENIRGLRPEDTELKSKGEVFFKISKYWWIVVVGWMALGVALAFIIKDDPNNPNELPPFFGWGTVIFVLLLGIWPLLKVFGRMQMKAVIMGAQNRRNLILEKIKRMKI